MDKRVRVGLWCIAGNFAAMSLNALLGGFNFYCAIFNAIIIIWLTEQLVKYVENRR